jgi:flagellar biosynthetic protein FlhB
LSGIKRLFSAQVVAELVKAIMKTALMGSVAAFICGINGRKSCV